MGTARGYDRLRRTVKKILLYINFTTPSQISIDVFYLIYPETKYIDIFEIIHFVYFCNGKVTVRACTVKKVGII
jgi:hypothetical protein